MIPLFILSLLSYSALPARGDGGHGGGDSDDDGDDDGDGLPTIRFNNPDNSTTCDNMIFSWTASGGNAAMMTLLVTNHNVPNHTAPSVFINETLTSAVSTGAQLFLWSKVDVFQGWYIAEAQLSSSPHTLLSRSSPFFVQSGSDMSCLSSASASRSATAMSSSLSTITPSTTPAFPPTATSPSSSSTLSAQSDATSHQLTTPQVIGTAIGSIAAFVILVFAFLCPQWWRRALPSRHRYNVMYY